MPTSDSSQHYRGVREAVFSGLLLFGTVILDAKAQR